MTDGPTAPSHLNLDDRKVFSLRAAYLRTLADLAPDALPSDEIQGEFDDELRKVSARVLGEHAHDPLDTFLTAVLDRTSRASQAALGGAYDEIKPVVDALRKRIDGVKCGLCVNGDICNGRAGDDRIVADGGRCISDIKEAMRNAKADATREYGRVPAVAVVVCTSGVSQAPTRIPGLSLAVNGQTWFSDDATTKTSIVTIEVASSLLDGQSMAALNYVALHEMFCHAYQMSARPGARENEGLFVDPIAEGMLDAVVVGLMEEKAQAAGVSDTGAASEADMARRIHLARKATRDKPRFSQAPDVALGALVHDGVLSLYSKEVGRNKASQAVRRLAYDLNLNGWDYRQRRDAFVRLRAHFLGKPRDPKLIDLLIRYLNTSSVNDLVYYLTNI